MLLLIVRILPKLVRRIARVPMTEKPQGVKK